MTQQIDWGDGSGDKIQLDFNAASGAQDVRVSSDPNMSENTRTKTVSFATIAGGLVTRILTVRQEPGVKEYTVELTPAAFVSGQYASISGQTNVVGKDETSTSYATVNLKTGNAAETWAFWSFDTSVIPAGATIVSVACSAKAMTQQTGGNRVTTYEMQLYKGTTTAKGSKTTLSTTATAYDMSCGSWTRAELDQCYIRLHAIRGKNSTTTTYYLRFYGATLKVTYKI